MGFVIFSSPMVPSCRQCGWVVLLVVLAAASSVEGEEGSYGNDRDFDMSPRLELGINRPMHSMWGARETDERGTYKELPQGAKLKISADQLKEVFDLQQDPLESMAADATAQSEDFVDDVLSDIVGGMGPEYAKRRAVGMGATKSAQSKHREHRRLKQGQLPSGALQPSCLYCCLGRS